MSRGRVTRDKVASGGRPADRGPSEDGFLRGHQVARVLGIAVPLVMILAWWGIWGNQGEIRSVSETTAVVIRDDGRICLVRVVTGEEVRLFSPRNLREGMTVRMTRTEYRNGELRFDLITRTAPGPEAITPTPSDAR